MEIGNVPRTADDVENETVEEGAAPGVGQPGEVGGATGRFADGGGERVAGAAATVWPGALGHVSHLEAWTALFSVLSEPTRLRIILLLAKGPRFVEDIAGELGMLQPAVSHQLSILRMRSLVVARYQGKRRYYSLAGCIGVNGEGLVEINIPGAVVQMRALMAEVDPRERR